MLYVKIGENGVFHMARGMRHAAWHYATHGGFDSIVARPIDGVFWEVMSQNIFGVRRLRVVCHAASRKAAMKQFWSEVESRMKKDGAVHTYSTNEFRLAAVGA